MERFMVKVPGGLTIWHDAENKVQVSPPAD